MTALVIYAFCIKKKNYMVLRKCKQTATICMCNIILQCSRLLTTHNFPIIDRKFDLTASKKSVIIPEIAKGKLTLEIFKIIERYLQSEEKIVSAPTRVRKRTDKGHSKVVLQRSLSHIKPESLNNSGLTSGEFFRPTEETTMSRTSRSRLS